MRHPPHVILFLLEVLHEAPPHVILFLLEVLNEAPKRPPPRRPRAKVLQIDWQASRKVLHRCEAPKFKSSRPTRGVKEKVLHRREAPSKSPLGRLEASRKVLHRCEASSGSPPDRLAGVKESPLPKQALGTSRQALYRRGHFGKSPLDRLEASRKALLRRSKGGPRDSERPPVYKSGGNFNLEVLFGGTVTSSNSTWFASPFPLPISLSLSSPSQTDMFFQSTSRFTRVRTWASRFPRCKAPVQIDTFVCSVVVRSFLLLQVVSLVFWENT
ncbi:hypothetical protein SODALDRAFT_109178 [Sodiomyces alkalinus F11]|uniref:Uncharacterized protein n=1 Tax=Sodiomyces alkalinus (strain CBS 110278 / VKM F-3762 / F11) TaxID=1314773 RepID=A0A3N2Q2N5_SODAK|nr:hypothetical protein SODALDRAFT_109178 [Sodiomyces alkalinus F11]ROT40986.1 hypothetical protein SODALDRAFT_109178 [Sodiomyces alkalinus F11]